MPSTRAFEHHPWDKDCPTPRLFLVSLFFRRYHLARDAAHAGETQQAAFGRFSRPPLERMLRLHERLKAAPSPIAASWPPSSSLREDHSARYRLHARPPRAPHRVRPVAIRLFLLRAGGQFPQHRGFPGEIIALFVARKPSSNTAAPPSSARCARLLGKSATACVTRSISSGRGRFRDLLPRPWHVGGDIDLFENVSKAVIESREIEFEYRKAKSPAYEPRRVRPYHLGCVSDQWYLFGFDLARDRFGRLSCSGCAPCGGRRRGFTGRRIFRSTNT